MRDSAPLGSFGAVILIFILTIMYVSCTAHAGVREQVTAEATRQHVDPSLALAIVEVESGFNQEARGSRGEVGLFQLRPEFHGSQILTVAGNIRIGVRYLASCQRTCAARYGDAAFVCYNRGPAAPTVEPKSTPYYQKVIALYRRNVEQTKRAVAPYGVADVRH
jgi:soluble lytic murein transglycosylase-like protein